MSVGKHPLGHYLCMDDETGADPATNSEPGRRRLGGSEKPLIDIHEMVQEEKAKQLERLKAKAEHAKKIAAIKEDPALDALGEAALRAGVPTTYQSKKA